MNEKTLKEYKKILFAAMKVFIAFCEHNDIKYFACSGTAIGALRHHGCIPWDDDIDVFLLRKDFDRLISLRTNLDGSGYRIVHHTDKGFPLPYAKFCDNNTTVWERKEYPFIEGVNIDIFPLDEGTSDVAITQKRINLFQRVWRRYEYSLASFSFADFVRALVKKDWILSAHILLCWGHYRWHKEAYYKAFVKLENEIKQIKGDRYVFYFCSYSADRELFRKEWFEDCSILPYEDFTIHLPKDPHAYLSQLFGDYMTPPPIEQRHSYHEHYYVNLNKRLEKREILNS